MMRPEDVAAALAQKQGVKRKLVKRDLMQSSEKVKRRPARLFHATPLYNFDSIKANGIFTHPFYGNSYFCATVEHCLAFMKGPCVVFEVDPKQLDLTKLYFSQDHIRAIYDFDAYAYYKKVFPKAIKSWSVHK